MLSVFFVAHSSRSTRIRVTLIVVLNSVVHCINLNADPTLPNSSIVLRILFVVFTSSTCVVLDTTIFVLHARGFLSPLSNALSL